MKTRKYLGAIAAVFLLASCGPSSVAVRERPAEPVYVRPAQPYAGAVLVPGEWVWRGRNYVYVQPHYVQPRRGRVYVQGHWDARPKGYVWRKGYWR